MERAAAAAYPDWPRYASRLRDAVVGLDADALALRAGPDHGPVWALAAHLAGSRVFWLCGIFGEPGADRTPWPAPLTDEGWDDDLTHPRSGDELRWALDSSWDIIRDCLERWPLDQLDHAAVRIGADGGRQVHSRASILNRLISHDAYHAGEISQLLGANGLPSADLWARAIPT